MELRDPQEGVDIVEPLHFWNHS